MAKVKVEFWMWLGKDVGPEFVSPTDTRACYEPWIGWGTLMVWKHANPTRAT